MAAEPLLDSDVDRVMLRRVGNGWIAITEHVDILKNHRRTVELVASTPAELASLVQQWAAAQLPEKREPVRSEPEFRYCAAHGVSHATSQSGRA
jgi:hypothetical protein